MLRPTLEQPVSQHLAGVPMLGPVSLRAARRANRIRVDALNGAERGSTVFIIGSGPQLNRLSPSELSTLAARPTIGVNRTQYMVDLRYFLSAYPAEVMLARKRSPGTTVVHMRPELAAPIVSGTTAVRRVDHRLGEPLEPRLDPSAPTIHTLRNVVLGATHLALVLGARRIVYIGVEQESALHFYDENPYYRTAMIDDLNGLRSVALFDIDHPHASREILLEKLRTAPEELARQPFYRRSHAGSFRAYFDELGRHGVRAFATTEASVIADGGAEVVPVGEALDW